MYPNGPVDLFMAGLGLQTVCGFYLPLFMFGRLTQSAK